MKKLALLFSVLILGIPVLANSSGTRDYMNQSESFAGFNKTLPQASSFKNLEKNTKYTPKTNKESWEEYDEELYSRYDEDGYLKDDYFDKPVKTEKKVIKTMKDANGKIKEPTSKAVPMTYEKFPQYYGNGDTMMLPTQLMPMGGKF